MRFAASGEQVYPNIAGAGLLGRERTPAPHHACVMRWTRRDSLREATRNRRQIVRSKAGSEISSDIAGLGANVVPMANLLKNHSSNAPHACVTPLTLANKVATWWLHGGDRTPTTWILSSLTSEKSFSDKHLRGRPCWT